MTKVAAEPLEHEFCGFGQWMAIQGSVWCRLVSISFLGPVADWTVAGTLGGPQD